MNLKKESTLLRIYLGEADKLKHSNLKDLIVREVKRHKLSGITVWNGLTGFGASGRIRRARILDLPSNQPIIIEIVAEKEKIDDLLPAIHVLFESAQCGGLLTLQVVSAITYYHESPSSRHGKWFT